MNLSLPLPFRSKPSPKTEQLTFGDLPISLYPITLPYEELPEIMSEYEVDMISLMPRSVKSSFESNNVELSIANPHTFIVFDQDKGIFRYVLVEPPIDQNIFSAYIYLIKEIERSLLSKEDTVDIAKILLQANAKMPSMGLVQGQVGGITKLSTKGKVALYYLLRNMFGYNVLTPLLADNKVEDISCSGIGLPVYVYHREYDYVPTNLTITESMKVLDKEISGSELLDQIVLRLISLSGKTVSIATPIADGILPKGDRIAATFRYEVSARGSSFVIRRFSERPITILDLINSGVMSPETAAYLWYSIDLRMSFMVIGVTGAGKTTVLGSILNLAKESLKIVSIEDIPEIKLAQENWVQLYARQAYGESSKEITLMDLLKLSLRYRPDIIVVGEIRGAESYILFQALSTGHGGATTFHAHDSESAVKRLMNPPLNIPAEWIPMNNIIISVRRLPVLIGDKIQLKRRVVAIDELVTASDFRRVVNWDPKVDNHVVDLDNAKVLRNRLEESGRSLEEVKEEIQRRALYLRLMATSKDIVQSPESYKMVKKYIIKYSLRPDEAMKEVARMSSIKVTV
ncbi:MULTISPECIES: type II/IV secretion system ATPase subunit [Metallosphaera]|uniref:Type II secretion system protein E n=5 Tax=Metallosphaera TaxID=41980 RepID=A4YEH3_METS5|nr:MULTISPECIES: type II/IV secretion system ATPase subunit [Metallosphaera]ABP94825.1 type II secretion system protein E [Metallosphaera sedula DSM 5348]AIM26812.1 type II secretion system protein E [Metallosphaera sedula]AKV73762.1 type II secretion system protein E [Metallosphaera sedula]AKV76002.1 type II secretion system protein E [Metallosphaera sedula]AKV78253.1 type II secretion system protein E [Metallosphaera sedula]